MSSLYFNPHPASNKSSLIRAIKATHASKKINEKRNEVFLKRGVYYIGWCRHLTNVLNFEEQQ